MADSRTRVGEITWNGRDKFPFIPVGIQIKFDHSISIVISGFAVGFDLAKIAQGGAASAHDEKTHPVRIGQSLAIHWRKAFIMMVVSVDDHLGAEFCGTAPERFYRSIVASQSRTKPRVMPVKQRAFAGIRLKILPEPFILPSIWPAGHVVTVAVERDDVPCTDVITVISQARFARRRAKVFIIGCAVFCYIIMVSGRRVDTVFVHAPGWAKAVAVFGPGSLSLNVVARGKDDCLGELRQQVAGHLVSDVRFAAVGNVTRADKHNWGRRGG